MQNASYVALSRQVVLGRQLDVTANNIANIDTVGFKRQGLRFSEFLAQTGNGEAVSYVQDVGSSRDVAQGSLRMTDRPLDLAIEGDGYFTVETPGGERYGRDGQFQLSAASEFTTRSGHALLSADGDRIVVPPGTQQIIIRKTGEILADGAEIAKIELKKFNNPQSLVHTADGLYKADAPGQVDPDARLHQGMLESSNVNPVVELVSMLQIQRDFEGVHKMGKTENERMTRAIRELGRVDSA